MTNKSSRYGVRFIALAAVFLWLTEVPLLAQKAQTCQHNKRSQLLGYKSAQADILRSDTLDVLHTNVYLDMTQMEASLLMGIASIDVRAKMEDVNSISLDLEGLTVDSVQIDGSTATFTYNSPLLVIDLDVSLQVDDEVEVTVYYQGSPIGDESGWGGFYFQSGYAFNLGVGFAADPHNYGRVWFPCFDNFVERTSFEYHILTDEGKTAYCGGVLESVESVGQDSLLSHWTLEEEIPSYLASIAVGNYTHASFDIGSISGEDIPAWLVAPAADTSDVLQSFVNLAPCFTAYENAYGPYLWPRVGYAFVPFSSGAMEHACNIAYPLSLAQGNLAYETLMAHELSHHWWGDLVTCKTQEDMWINEGMASYSESLFLESVYGEEAYLESVRDNLKDVLLNAHINDGEHLAISGIDHSNTYGDHVYNKGALVAHNLRTTMEADFFLGLQSVTDAFQFSDIDSYELRDALQVSTEANLTPFFDQWVFAPGFPEFRIKSFTGSVEAGAYDIEIEQHVHYAPQLYSEVPLLLSLRDAAGSIETHHVMASGELTFVTIPSALDVEFAYLNANDGILEAVLSDERILNSTGIKVFDFAEFRVNVDQLGTDSTWMRVENHWASAGQEVGQIDMVVSSDRFWRLRAEESNTLSAEVRLRYYGNTSSSNYFDPLFFQEMGTLGLTENDLVAVYRSLNSTLWNVIPEFELNVQGDETNFQGYLDAPWMGNGDYAWAYLTGLTDIRYQTIDPTPEFYPLPCQTQMNVKNGQGWNYEIFNSQGQLTQSGTLGDVVDTSQLASGHYVLKARKARQFSILKFQKID